MKPQIIQTDPKNMVVLHVRTCFAENQTFAQWQQFRRLAKTIEGDVPPGFYAIRKYDDGLRPHELTPHTLFDQYAAVEIADPARIPEELMTFQLPAGLYAVFMHRGTAAVFHQTMHTIHTEWLPNSGFEWDDRPHFEYMPPDYHPMNPESEEEIWIPIRPVSP